MTGKLLWEVSTKSYNSNPTQVKGVICGYVCGFKMKSFIFNNF